MKPHCHLHRHGNSAQCHMRSFSGNEATGLPTSFASAGTAVRIPHSDAIDSLNLAVAVSIAAYAFTQEDETGGPLLPCKRGGEK